MSDKENMPNKFLDQLTEELTEESRKKNQKNNVVFCRIDEETFGKLKSLMKKTKVRDMSKLVRKLLKMALDQTA